MKHFIVIDSPIDPLLAISDGTSLTHLYFGANRDEVLKQDGWQESPQIPALQETRRQLHEFLAGKRRMFELPLSARGTEFQRECWNQLRQIPFAETRSYGEMARTIEKPNAFRAVGAANGQNPISIIVPCHRVIGASGRLVGFGGGLPRKAALLSFERAMAFGEDAAEFWAANALSPAPVESFHAVAL